MNVKVHLQKVAANGYRATSIEPHLSVEGETRDDAIGRIRGLLAEYYSKGEWIDVSIPTSGEPHPLKAFAGIWKDVPEFEEFVEAMKEYRREVDADPNR